MEIQLLFVESVRDIAKDLITVASGIIGLSITFHKDVVNQVGGRRMWALKWSWLVYLLSVIFGFLTLMTVAGSLARAVSSNSAIVVLAPNVRWSAALQICAFVLATMLLIIYGTGALASFHWKKK